MHFGLLSSKTDPHPHEHRQRQLGAEKTGESIPSLQATIHKYTPKGALKPNATVLISILRDLSAHPAECVYVGDSLMKDIAMANEVGVYSAHAKYGEAHTSSYYELLKEVTHWPTSLVNREETLKPDTVIPNFVLRGSFSEILSHCLFASSEEAPNNEIRDQLLTIWEKTVDVQQHFNDLSLKVRGLAVTVLGAILSAVAFSLKEQIKGQSDWTAVPPLVPALFLVAIISWLAFWLMDQLWYHRLLKGAVKHGLRIEETLQSELPVIGLTSAIGKASATTLFKKEIRSDAKLTIFYSLVLVILVFALLATGFLSWFKSDAKHTGDFNDTAKQACCPAPVVDVHCLAVPPNNLNVSSAPVSASQPTQVKIKAKIKTSEGSTTTIPPCALDPSPNS